MLREGRRTLPYFLNHFCMDIKPQIAVLAEPAHPERISDLIAMAERLQLPVIDAQVPPYSHFLTIRQAKLELWTREPPGRSPLSVDFLSGPVYYRFLRDRTINQPMAKAVGVKGGYRPAVLDGTAGFGEDGFVLASLGCMVTMIERSPIIWALLADAIVRSEANDTVAAVFDEYVELKLADTIDYLASTQEIYDTVFLDPMYPSTPKTPLNKQRMRTLRELVGSDTDTSELLTAALNKARIRVAVKRPVRAAAIDQRKPTFSINSKRSRYDVYLVPYL